jgi:hypothetical protein
LAVEDCGDRRVVVVGGEPLQQDDRVLGGANRWPSLGQRDCELGERAAPPTERDRHAALGAIDVDNHFLDHAPQ